MLMPLLPHSSPGPTAGCIRLHPMKWLFYCMSKRTQPNGSFQDGVLRAHMGLCAACDHFTVLHRSPQPGCALEPTMGLLLKPESLAAGADWHVSFQKAPLVQTTGCQLLDYTGCGGNSFWI